MKDEKSIDEELRTSMIFRLPVFATRCVLMSTEILKSKEAYDQAVQQFLKLSQEVKDMVLRNEMNEKIAFRIRIFVVLFSSNKLPTVSSIIGHLIFENMHSI